MNSIPNGLSAAVEAQFSQNGLPVSERLGELSSALSQDDLVALKAPPGSGKTLLSPVTLLESRNYSRVLVLEPRRVTAKLPALALRQVCGDTVGYQIRADKLSTQQTQILFLTYGTALQTFAHQPPQQNELVIFDEFHERPWQAELLLALLRSSRAKPKILLMSATLDASILPEGTPLIESDGKLHPVELSWEKNDSLVSHDKRLLAKLVAKRSKELADPKGEQLIFLPGKAELLATQQLLQKDSLDGPVELLHSSVPEHEVQRIVNRPRGEGFRRILSTDIAESSVTLPGVNLVIDSGLARRPYREPLNLGSSLRTQRAPKSALEQRTGRAGRLSQGRCHRLFSKASEEDREGFSESGLRQADPEALALTLAAYGRLKNWRTLPWLEAPDEQKMETAYFHLHQHKLLDSQDQLTHRGTMVFRLPLTPRLGLFATLARESGLALATVNEICQAIHGEHSGLLSLEDKLHRPFSRDPHLESRLKSILSDQPNRGPKGSVSELLLQAFQPNLARFRNQRALSALADQPSLLWEHPPLRDSNLGLILGVAPTFVSGARNRVTLFHPLDSSTIWETLFESLEEVETVEWDQERKEFRRFRDVRFGQLSLERQALKLEPSEALADQLLEIFADQVRGQSSLIERIHLFLTHRPNWLKSLQARLPPPPALNAQEVIHALKRSYLSTVVGWSKSSPQELDLHIEGLLPRDFLKTLDVELPRQVQLPGRQRPVPIRYTENASPFVASKLQDFMNWQAPSLLGGEVKLLFHLLAPNGRPAQVTDDLEGFWQGSYVQVRKDLRGRYPKHHWPEANELKVE